MALRRGGGWVALTRRFGKDGLYAQEQSGLGVPPQKAVVVRAPGQPASLVPLSGAGCPRPSPKLCLHAQIELRLYAVRRVERPSVGTEVLGVGQLIRVRVVGKRGQGERHPFHCSFRPLGGVRVLRPTLDGRAVPARLTPGGDGGLGRKGGCVRRGHGDSSSPLKAHCSDVYIQTSWPMESLMAGKQEFSGEGL